MTGRSLGCQGERKRADRELKYLPVGVCSVAHKGKRSTKWLVLDIVSGDEGVLLLMACVVVGMHNWRPRMCCAYLIRRWGVPTGLVIR